MKHSSSGMPCDKHEMNGLVAVAALHLVNPIQHDLGIVVGVLLQRRDGAIIAEVRTVPGVVTQPSPLPQNPL